MNVLSNIIPEQAKRYGDRLAMSLYGMEGDLEATYSYNQLNQAVNELACAMETLDIHPGDVCMIYSNNRPEIVITDFACYHNRAIPVAVYATMSQEQLQYIAQDCLPKIVFVGDAEQEQKVRNILPDCPSIKHVVTFYPGSNMTFEHLLQLGSHASELCRAEVEKRRLYASPSDTATLIYTSGTTGEPKGVDLPHSCFNAVVRIHHERLTMLSDRDTSLCFLPLCHIFEKAWTYFCISQGMSVSVNENAKIIADVIKKVRPTCMCSVPRFWEKAYAGIQEKIGQMGFAKRMMVRMALSIGHARNLKYARMGKKAPWPLEKLYRLFDRQLFEPVRRIIGIDKGNIFPTAGAPISPNIVEFFHEMGVDVLVGYGLSETTATVTCFPNVGYVIGSVGTVMPDLQVRIGLQGEIEVKGPTVMRCYYNKPRETQEAFTKDGWLRTGDAGYFDEEGALVLTERLKDLFKTSNGKYIAPQAIESRLGEDKYIEQVAVVGESRKYVTAIIIPAFGALKEYAMQKHIAYKNLEDLIRNSEIVKMMAARIEKLQKGLPSFEQIKKFTMLPKAFTIESGELTNTLKIRRPVINAHYAKEIEQMYAV